MPGVDELDEEHGTVLADRRRVAYVIDHEQRRIGENTQSTRQVVDSR